MGVCVCVSSQLFKTNMWNLRVCVCVCVFSGCGMCVCVFSVVSALCDPMDRSLPGSSIHRTLQARILEWVAIPFSRGSSRPRKMIEMKLFSGQQ